MNRRAYRNDNIYRIIGGMHCLRVDGVGFICGSASAIEARRAETQGGSVEDESAVPKADARNSSEPSS